MTSLAELTLAAQLEQAGIPFEREYRFHPSRRWRADFAVEVWVKDYGGGQRRELPILVEVEGGIGSTSRHLTYTGFSRDCEKYAMAAILGYRVIRATPAQVDDGIALSWIKQALGIEEVDRVAS
jgi:hypothetical protein